MQIAALVVCAVLAWAGAVEPAQTPARQDFSGEWVLDPSKTTTTGAPMRVAGPAAAGMPGRGVVTEPRKIKHVSPVYPVNAQQARITGMVVLEAIISKTGRVRDLRVLRSVPELDRAAMDAVAKWEYTPTLVDGLPVEVIMTVTVTFSLDTARPAMGAPVPGAPPAWPSPPVGAGRSGFGRGSTAPVIVIAQDDRSLTMIRRFGDASEEVKYQFDGRATRNRLPGTGGAVDNTYIYVSKWDGARLLTTISWIGPQGPRERTETISIDGDALTIQTSRAPLEAGGEPFVVTNVFNRKR